MKLLALTLALLIPASAQACRLALALGLDISSSVSPEEDALQRQGLANALRQRDVQAAILASPNDPVAIAVFEWSGRVQQDLILDWTLLPDAAAINRTADTIAASRRSYADFATAVGSALHYADTLMTRAPRCLTQTLDLSGDGIQNEGPAPAQVYASGQLRGTTVNGLAILGALDDMNYDANLMAFYRNEILQGAAPFLEVANGFEDFPRAMIRKLIRETTVQVFGELHK